MKKSTILLLAVAAMAASSCAKENLQENSAANLSPITISVSSEPVSASSEAVVKAAFDSDNYPAIVWTGTESISVLGASTGNRTFSTTDSGSEVEFSGLASLSDEVLYAVYPADATVTLNSGETVTLSGVTVPAVQTATAGSFDPKANVCVASTTADKRDFTFKSLVAFLKFRLDDAENVEKVVFVGNNGENMACTASAVTLEGSHGGTYTSVSKSITVNGPFKSDCDYFATTRPQSFTNGITIYVQYSDGTVKSCKTTGQLFETGKSRNVIRLLGTIPSDKLKKVTDRYELYSAGFDITVGGVTVNKTSYPNANYISASSADKTLKGGVNFVDADAVAEFPTTEGIALPFIVVGNTEGSRTKITASSQVKFTSTETVANNIVEFQNVSLSTDGISEGYLLSNTKDNVIQRIGFNDCSIEIVGDKNLSYMSSARNVNSFVVKDCDVKANSSKAVYMLQVQANEYTMTELTFDNNVFWSDSAVQGFCLYHNRKSAVSTVTITHNTFVNVYPQASYAYCQLNDLVAGSISNNLFYFTDYTTNCNTKYTGIVKEETNTNVDETLYEKFVSNYAIYAEGSVPTQRMKVGQNTNKGTIYNKVPADASAIFDFGDDSANFNIAKGIFKSKSTVYGAQR